MADVGATLVSWSSTTGSNSPAGATSIAAGLDDNLRELQGVVVRGLSHKGSDIASATTTDLGAVEGLMHDITGTTTITGFGTVRAGILKIIKFEGALTLTHHATSLILPGGANITTANGDTATVISEGSGNWRCIHYTRTGTAPLGISASTFTPTIVGASTAGTQDYSNQVGHYFKIGQLVFVSIYVSITATSGATGSVNMGGLPFTSASPQVQPLAVSSFWNFNLTAGKSYLGGHVLAGDTNIRLMESGDNVDAAEVDAATVMTATSAIRLAGCYLAAS